MAGSIGQLTTLQVQRLKSELGEVIIADFCNPRFMDYRADMLRSRPTTRRQRHEVWQYLESVDFSAALKAGPNSPKFQQQLERIILGYIERNPAFQGRFERAGSDARGRVHQAVTEVVRGFREYLQQGERSRFGFPRPVESWAGRYGDLSWAAIEQSTRYMQEALLASRADDIALARELNNGQATLTPYSAILAALFSRSGGRPVLTGPVAAPAPSSAMPEPVVAEPAPVAEAMAPAEPATGPAVPPQEERVPSGEAVSAGQADQGEPIPQESLERLDQLYSEFLQEEAPDGGLEVHYVAGADGAAPVPDAGPMGRRAITTELPALSAPHDEVVQVPAAAEAAAVVTRDTDISLFAQVQQQVTIWIKVAAVSHDLDIAGLSVEEIVARLRQAAAVGETELTIATSLLDLADRVQRAGQASLLDYKRALMLHLLHRRPRLLL
jgi:hypothetical protein